MRQQALPVMFWLVKALIHHTLNTQFPASSMVNGLLPAISVVINEDER